MATYVEGPEEGKGAKEAKKALRKHIKQKVSQLDEKEVMCQSRKAQDVVLQSPQYRQAKRIGIYLSMPKGEAQTDSLLGNALWSGKKVFVPHIYTVGTEKAQRKVMDMMRIGTLTEYGELQRDSWGIPTLTSEGMDERENAMGGKGLSFAPDGRAVESDGGDDEGGLDMIVVPAVSFDRNLNRLGHGAGFYDRYLERGWGNGQRKRPYLIGICLAEQIVPEGKLVMEPWDWKVDAVSVGDGTLLTPQNSQ